MGFEDTFGREDQEALGRHIEATGMKDGDSMGTMLYSESPVKRMIVLPPQIDTDEANTNRGETAVGSTAKSMLPPATKITLLKLLSDQIRA